MKIVIDSNIPFMRGVLEKHAEVVYLPGSAISRSDVKDADGLIIRTRTKCNASLLEGTSVVFIASATIGYDHIDTEYCRSQGIQWRNATGCNSSSVQQYVAAALLCLSEQSGFSLDRTTIGIVGVGNVGTRVEQFCRTMGMNVLLNDPPRERREGTHAFVSLDRIIKEADIITLHVPLNRKGIDKTYHLVDDNVLGKLSKGQILINTSRGEVCKTGALKSVLNRRKIAGCVLDVWEHEPRIDTELLGLVTIASPHIAGYSADGKANGSAMSVRAMSRHFGFGLDQWFPAELPLPKNTLIEIDNTQLCKEEVVGKAVRSTYNITADDQRLRTSPATFEKQREEYPLRREFGTYGIRLTRNDKDTEMILRTIGFHLIQ